MRLRPHLRSAVPQSPNQALLTAAVLAALAVSAPAQLQFDALPGGALPSQPDSTNGVAIGDVDGDGDLDLFFANAGYPSSQNRLLLNDGSGNFTEVTATQLPTDSDVSTAAAFGDVDADGDLDLVVTNQTYAAAQTRLYTNDGAGNFTDVTTAQMPADNDLSLSVALGDVDGDGDLDMVIGNSGYSTSQNRLYTNDGAGNFTDVTATQLPANSVPTNAVAFGDVDGDGDLDIVFGNSGYSTSQNQLLRNDGTGNFTDDTATAMPLDNDGTFDVELADVDGDGDLDMVLGNAAYGYFGQQSRLYLNDGTGNFADVTASNMPIDRDNTADIAIGDIDGDGDLDMVLGNRGFCAGWKYSVCYGEQSRLFVNDGSGSFIDVTSQRMLPNATATAGIALGDVDGDSDLDLILANNSPYYYGPERNQLYLNLKSQLHAPDPFRIGQTYTLESYLRYDQSSGQADFALPFISPLRASVPFAPFGTIGIDPSAAVPLPLIQIPQPAGVGSTAVSVPTVGGLIGISFYSQALLVPTSGLGGLSNVVCDLYEPLPMPTITDIQPPVAGAGVNVTITGTNFLQGVILRVDGVQTPITSFTETTMDFMMPAGPQCDTLIEVENLINSIATETMNLTPVISSVTYPTGKAVGGEPFELVGQHFTGSTVLFNGGPLPNLQIVSDTLITGTTPPGPVGAVPVTVSNANGCQDLALYTYHATPTILSIAPEVAGPGTPVTVSGDNFLSGVSVTVGTTPTPVTASSPTSVSFVMPPGYTCDTNVTVTNAGTGPVSTSATMNNTPVVVNWQMSGLATGNSLFWCSGQHLQGTTVTFNGVPMTAIQVQSSVAIVGFAPPGTPGPATVVITNANGCSTSFAYTYL